jgi:hypothetical protein
MPVTYSGTGTTSAAGVWIPVVTLNAVNVSAKVVGEIVVEAEEGSARIASLTLRPAPGDVFTIAAWVGKSLTIDIADYATGSATSIQRLFTGIVDTPTLNLDARTISVTATDNLQNIIEGMSNAAIDAAIPSGYASPVVFDPAARGWSRAQDRLSTVAASLDLTPAGSLRLTPWAPDVTPDLLFTSSHILENTLNVSLTSRSQLINQVDIDFGYRFPRVKAEGHDVSYDYVDLTGFAAYVAAGGWFLQRLAVEAAIKAAGGTIESITYEALPTSAIGTWIPGPYDIELCMGFDAVVSFDYGQEIEEQFAITVSAPNSVSAVGTLKDRLSGALVGEYPPIIAVENALTLYKNEISGIPPTDLATPSAGFTTAANVTLTPETDRSAANAAMQALIATAKVRIWGSHRLNTVGASVPLNPSIDLDQTVEISITSINARGKCRRVTHRMSPDSAMATSDFGMAICSVAGTGVTHADSAITAPAGSSPATTVLSSSATVDFNGGAAEDHIITITFPAVASGERNRAIVPLTSSYSATLTEDLFTLTL